MRRVLSIDIGSTYTKGALFDIAGRKLQLLGRCGYRTTTKCLASGFRKVAAELLGLTSDFSRDELREKAEVCYSSSAKGGLNVAVSGIVPDLTLKMARETACSAGAKIGQVFSYKLTTEDLAVIQRDNPDIILLAGGTDGGTEAMIVYNAKMLKKITPCPPIIYAGNRVLRERITKIFEDRECYLTENILPTLDKLNPEPARDCIGKIFLENIVVGKGLDEIVKLTGVEPMPTPYVMLEFVKNLSEQDDNFRGVCIIDLGGATTDVYSCVADECENAMTIHRGLPEPLVKRTVEGDIGMRYSAASAVAAVGDYWKRRLAESGGEESRFLRYLELLGKTPEYLPETAEEMCFERILAASCVRVALKRHAGKQETVYTMAGAVTVRAGKDLRGVKTVIGTGGYLAGVTTEFFMEALAGIKNEAPEALLPEPGNVAFISDHEYLLPLLANVGRTHSPALSWKRLISAWPKINQVVCR